MLKQQPETLAGFGRVANLVEGFGSAFGLELLATVHRVTTRERVQEEAATVRCTRGATEAEVHPRQIRLTVRRLAEAGWIPSMASTAET